MLDSGRGIISNNKPGEGERGANKKPIITAAVARGEGEI
jgi:hypothetical protein